MRGGRRSAWRRGVHVVSVLAGVLGSAHVAHAAPPGQPFRLEYWARGTCPDAIEFSRQIRSRAPRLRPAEGDEPALGFYAELDDRSGYATGRLTARSPDGREVTRTVRGPTCDDVVTALALIAALAADPVQPLEVPASEPVARKRAPPRARRTPDSDVSSDETPYRAFDEPTIPEPTERWTYGVGGGVEFNSAIAPSQSYGISVSFEAEAPGGSIGRAFWSLSAIRAASGTTSTAGSDASFSWFAFRLDGCPARWPELKPLFLRPCAFFDVGALQANISTDPEDSHSSTHTWVSAGAFLRIEALVGDDAISFQLDGGVVAPLTHGGFGPAFQVPSAGILGRIGLSYRFQ